MFVFASDGVGAELSFNETLTIDSPVAVVVALPLSIRGGYNIGFTSYGTIVRYSITGTAFGQNVDLLVERGSGSTSGNVLGAIGGNLPLVPAGTSGVAFDGQDVLLAVPAGTTTTTLDLRLRAVAYATALGNGGGIGSGVPLSSRIEANFDDASEGLVVGRLLRANGGPLPAGFSMVGMSSGVVYEGCDGGTSGYCQGTTNSTGAAATISTAGTTSFGANNFALEVNGLPPSTSCVFLYGADDGFSFLGNGTLCLGSAPQRLSGVVMADASGAVSYTVDLQAPPVNSAFGSSFPDSVRFFQLWYRDPGVGAGFNTSSAVAVAFCP